jgi:hypothetical protein
MTWKTNVLVVANVTATSPELFDALLRRSDRDPCSFTLIVPATAFGGGFEAASQTLTEALTRMRDAGLQAEGAIGNADPIVAVSEIWDPRRHDEIIVATLPLSSSKWLRAGLPERIGKLTGAPVTHVVSQSPKPAAHTFAPREHQAHPMGPLTVLGWGSYRERSG